MSEMINAVIYARYSSDKQTEQSIEGQLRDCHEYAKKRGFRIVGEYIDRALTGRNDERPEFLKMIGDASKKQFQYVIVWKLDRFARNRYDSAIYKHKLKQYGVRVLSAMEAISDDPEGIILEAFLEAVAEYYSVNLAQNVKRGMRESALKGNSTGGTIPIGYKIVDKKLVIDDAYAPIVRFCFEQYAAGVGKKEIVKSLNERGYRTKQGKPFTIDSLSRMFTNKKYIGVYHYTDGEGEIEIEGGCPAIIDKDLFEKCAAISAKNKRAPARKKAKVEYLLQGKLFCGHCGSNMIGESGRSSNGNTYHYYSCATRKKYKTCKKKNEKKDFIEWYVVEQTLEYVLTPGRIDYIAERVAAMYEDEFSNSKIDQLEKQLKEIEKEMDKIYNLLLNAGGRKTIIDKANARFDELEAQKADIEIDLAKLRIASKIKYSAEEIKLWLHQFCKGDLFDMNFRRRIIDAFINSIYLFDDKLIVYYNIKDAKQISYIEALENAEELQEDCSDLIDSGSPNTNLSEHVRFIFVNGLFGCVFTRE